MLPERHKDITLDEYVIMPNHLHGIIVITDGATGAGEYRTDQNRAGASPAPTNPVGASLAGALVFRNTIGNIVGAFKSLSSNEWLKIIKAENINTRGKFWQRNYYEHIIRNDDELNRARQYTIDNPLKWELDEENPVNAIVGARYAVPLQKSR